MVPFKIVDSPNSPKYLQLAEAIIDEIHSGKLALNERLPSVNKFSKQLNISRETVFKALNHLSEKGVIKSANRRGYYVQKTDDLKKFRICLIMDKLTSFKEQLYHSFVETIGEKGEVDVFFHHHNLSLFRNLVLDNVANYTHLAVVTFFKESTAEILNLIPAEKRIILDSFEPDLVGNYSMVYQDFVKDIYDSLMSVKHILANYKRLIMVAPGSLYHVKWVTEGFNFFCKEFTPDNKIIPNIDASDFKKGDVYLTSSAYNRELVELIKLCREKEYQVGKDIGIICFNDTPMKEVLEGGITVISTDFEQMGRSAGQLILNGETKIIPNPTQLILRNSL